MPVIHNPDMRKFIAIILGLYITIISTSACLASTQDKDSFPLIITEIMPNPKGADKGQEWVEIYNTTQQRISLSNWKLNNGKVFTIPEGLSILPNGYFVLQNSNLKITLKNSNAFLTLTDPSGKIVQEIFYNTSKEEQSYSLITIRSASRTKTVWEWTSPTKGEQNQTLYLIIGEILTSPQINEDFYFEIKSGEKNIKIVFSETKFNFELMQTLLQPATQTTLIIEKINNKYVLKDFKVINPTQKTSQSQKETQPTNHWEYILLAPIILLSIFTLYISKKQQIKTSSLPSSPDIQVQQNQRELTDNQLQTQNQRQSTHNQ
jgi:hypothetical protein